MTSICHTTSPNRGADDLLLDAAMECVLAVGVRRTTLSDVARTAGVSRMTLYRRFPDVRGMLSALITREFGKILAAANEAAREEPTARGQLVVASVHTIRALAANPLMHAVIERDAELLRKAAPDATVYTATIDRGLDGRKFIVPGLGDFGDRLFGT